MSKGSEHIAEELGKDPVKVSNNVAKALRFNKEKAYTYFVQYAVPYICTSCEESFLASEHGCSVDGDMGTMCATCVEIMEGIDF